MAITSLSNTANVVYNGTSIVSNTVDTVILCAPTIFKAVDKSIAMIGDILTYTVTIKNIAIGEITCLRFTDVLPAGSAYVTGSFTENGTAATPTLTGSTLSYTIPKINSGADNIIVFKVKVTG